MPGPNKSPGSPEEYSSNSEPHNSDQTDDEISEPCLDNRNNTMCNESPLPEGHTELLTVTVVDREVDPSWRYSAQLDVLLEDGAQLPLNIWSVHDVPLSWQVGATYTLKNVKHKIRETATGQKSVLRSTSSFTATQINKNNSKESSKSSSMKEIKQLEVGNDEKTGTNNTNPDSQEGNLGGNQTNTCLLPDDRINKLTVRVLAREEKPGWKNNDELTVSLGNGKSLPLHIWSVHDISFSWKIGATYVLTQVRHKIQEDSGSKRCLLHSTKQLQVARVSSKDPSEALEDTSQLQSNSLEPDDTWSLSQHKNIDNVQTGPRAQDYAKGDNEATSCLIKEISYLANILQEPPTKGLLMKYGKYSPKVYTETFDTWASAIEASGYSQDDLPDNNKRKYSNLEILDGIQEAATKVGHRPTTIEADKQLEFSAGLASLRFGSWDTAVNIAVGDNSSFRSNRNADSSNTSKEKELDVEYNHSNRDAQNHVDIQDVIESTIKDIME